MSQHAAFNRPCQESVIRPAARKFANLANSIPYADLPLQRETQFGTNKPIETVLTGVSSVDTNSDVEANTNPDRPAMVGVLPNPRVIVSPEIASGGSSVASRASQFTGSAGRILKGRK